MEGKNLVRHGLIFGFVPPDCKASRADLWALYSGQVSVPSLFVSACGYLLKNLSFHASASLLAGGFFVATTLGVNAGWGGMLLSGEGTRLRNCRRIEISVAEWEGFPARFTPVSYTHLTLPTNREV